MTSLPDGNLPNPLLPEAIPSASSGKILAIDRAADGIWDDVTPGSQLWSETYQRVKNLRKKYDLLMGEMEKYAAARKRVAHPGDFELLKLRAKIWDRIIEVMALPVNGVERTDDGNTNTLWDQDKPARSEAGTDKCG